MPTLSLIINTAKNPDDFRMTGTEAVKSNLSEIENLIRAFKVGAVLGDIALYGSTANPVKASGTITLVSPVATNTVTIGKTVFTATASPSSNTATAVDFLVTGSDTVVAAALAAAINANALGAALIVSATSALGVVTVTALVPGVLANQIALAKSGAPITVSGTYLASGAGGPGGAPVNMGR